jgi:hypothetical protein
MNGTQKHSLWRHPILSEVPARFIFVFLRSNAGEGRDGIEDKAIIYSLNITNVAKGPAFRCVRCPRMVNNECLPCPQGHFFDQKVGLIYSHFLSHKYSILINFSKQQICRICSPGSTMNFSAVSDSEENVPTCSPCPVFLEGGNDDSSACTFTGRFKLKNPTNNETLTFDMSPLRGLSLSAEGIKV